MLSADIKKLIDSTYTQYNDGSVEMEARFGVNTRNGFKPGVTRQVFNRIRDYFENKSTPQQSQTTDYIGKNVRKTVTNPIGDGSPEIIWIQKTRLWNQDDPNYGIRYSMSREINIDPVPNFTPDIIREKNRYSYYVYNGTVRIDITMVNMVQNVQNTGNVTTYQGEKKTNQDETKYEVELELLDPRGLNNFESALKVLLYRILDTLVLYTQDEFQQVISSVNRNLGSTLRGKIDHEPLVQARNLKLKDMVWGGLIGNKDTAYSVTHKADGTRKMMVFHSTGIWLITPPYSLNRIYNKEIPILTGTILDGEVVPLEKRKEGAPKTRIWYLVFDCLSVSGQYDIQNKPHKVRMNQAQMVADMPLFKSEFIHVNTKTFKNFTTPFEFFNIMNDMFLEQKLIQYDQDGFMFTPVDYSYNPHSDKHPLYQRVLTKYPDICKWKPQDQLTIDFAIKWLPSPSGTRSIQLYSNEKGKLVLFKGTKAFPYTGTIDSTNPMTSELPNGTVVEYGWDYNKNIFIPHRVRFDKTKPNKMDIAEDVWMDIQNPLDQDTMTGKNLTLLRRYHNRIKEHLYSRETTHDKNDKTLTLLDIGSGRGGDVAKWKRRYSKVVAVEPNPEHIIELKRRIELHGMTDKVRIVNTGGEDIETIYKNVREFIGGRVDVVSMMLSMSFFWRSQSMVNRLVNTIISNIKPDGEFVFLTIDGDLVEQTFEHPPDKIPITQLDLGLATLRYFGNKTPKELHIHIEGTIVEDQTEWLVRLNDLTTPLREFGFDYIEHQRANEEEFLSNNEIILTQMYTYGVIANKNKIEKKYELPDIDFVIPGKEKFPGLLTNPNEIPQIKDLINVENIIQEEIKSEDKMKNISTQLPPLPPAPRGTARVKPIPVDIPLQDQTPQTNVILPPIPGTLPTVPFALPTVPGALPTVPLVPGTLPPVPGALPTIPLVPGSLPPVTGVLPGVLPTVPVTDNLPTLEQITKEIQLEELGNTDRHQTNIDDNMEDDIDEIELPLIPTDTYQYINVLWYPNEKVVRIGAIGDGSCFFHSVLGGYYPPYQNENNENVRRRFVQKLRRDIAYTLQMNDSENPGHTMWENAARGQFKNLYEQQKLGLVLDDGFGYYLDFSLEGLQQLFNSSRYLGDEVYQYASDILGIDIYVMRLTNKNLYVHLNTSKRGVERKAVVISGNGSHYETVGVERNGMFQTVFDSNDPFILAIKDQVEEEIQYDRTNTEDDLIATLQDNYKAAEALGDVEALREIQKLLDETQNNK
jgi:SAM-dependent methyltransferase